MSTQPKRPGHPARTPPGRPARLAARAHRAAHVGSRTEIRSINPDGRPSALELVAEVADLATGLGILAFVLAPFALPLLALTAVLAAPLLVASVLGVILLAPVALAVRWRGTRNVREAADRHAPGGHGEEQPANGRGEPSAKARAAAPVARVAT